MKFGNIIKNVGVFGESGTASRTVFGTGPRFVPSDGVGGFTRSALGVMKAVQDAQTRANEIAVRTDKTFQNPVVRAFLGTPPERQAPQWTSSAARVASAGPRYGSAGLPNRNFSLASDYVRLIGTSQSPTRGWQSLGRLFGQDRIEGPPLARGLVTDFKVTDFKSSGIAGTKNSILGSGARDTFRPHHFSRFTTRPFGPPALGQLGTLVRDLFGPFRRFGELIAGWLTPTNRFFKQAVRRAWELYPRDSEGRPIPPWSLRLYFLAWAAYRLNDYGTVARFLDEIGADDSSDNVLFVRDLLAPTFDPKRPDRRTNWWLLDPDEAKHALCKRLVSLRSDDGIERRNGEVLYLEDPEDDNNPKDPYFYVVRRAPRTVSAERTFFNDERPTLLLQELAAVLPTRQYEVVSLASRGWTYDRIGHQMGITEGAVKAHMYKVRNNQRVAEVLRPQSALRPDTAQIRGRTHRE